MGLISGASAQLPTWVDDIAPLIHDHCSRWHHVGGAGPFPLLSYEDAFFNASEAFHAMQDGDEDLVFEVIDGVNQVREPSNTELNISPNPTSSNFNIDGHSVSRAVIRDGSGRFVWSRVLNGSQSNIQTEGWASGIYSIEVNDGSTRITRQIIVE